LLAVRRAPLPSRFVGSLGGLGGTQEAFQLRQLDPAEVDLFKDLFRQWECE
jgi:hypothetical protein